MIKLTINIPDPPKQCLIDMSFHFQDGQLVEYTAPSGWSVKEQPKREKLLPCTCGANSRALWFEGSKLFYKCHGCGRKVYGNNKADLRRQWNAAMKEVEE